MKGFVRSSAALLSALPLLQATGVPQIPGYEVTWSDDFASQRHSRPDPEKWIIDTGTGYPGGPQAWGTWEIQTYTNSPRNIRVSEDGNLQITALRDVQGGWTSSRIETQRGDFMAQPGGKMRIQARLKIPDLGGEGYGLGYWSAFWSLGSEFRGNYWNWPGVGEFDIMENVNNLDRVWGVLHCDKNPGGECDESNGLGDYRSCPGSPCPGNFHTYAIEVDRSTTPEKLTWLVDDIAYHEIPEWWLSESVWQQTVHVPHFVLLNLAIGGGFPDGVAGFQTPTNATLSGGTYEAEYVAVYNSV